MDFKTHCRNSLDQFFQGYQDGMMQEEANKVLTLLVAYSTELRGKPEGWAAGILYAVANRNRFPIGVPGLLNSELEALFNVSMSTVYKRAAQLQRLRLV